MPGDLHSCHDTHGKTVSALCQVRKLACLMLSLDLSKWYVSVSGSFTSEKELNYRQPQ
jgi:hypothetical protein